MAKHKTLYEYAQEDTERKLIAAKAELEDAQRWLADCQEEYDRYHPEEGQ